MRFFTNRINFLVSSKNFNLPTFSIKINETSWLFEIIYKIYFMQIFKQNNDLTMSYAH